MATIYYSVDGGAEQQIDAPYGVPVEIPGSAELDVAWRVETDEQTGVYVAPSVIQPPVGELVVAIWQQSETHRILSEYYDTLPKEPLVRQDQVTFWWHDRETSGAEGVQSVTLNDTTRATSQVTAAMVAMANTFMRATDRPVRLVMHVLGGTDPREIMDSGFGGTRDWNDDWALHAAATADGAEVSHLWSSWFAAPGSLGDDYGEAMAAFLFGRDLNGAALTYSEAAPYALDVGGGTVNVERTLRDLYGDTVTVIPPASAHRFDPTEDMQSATLLAGGGAQANFVNKQRCTLSWRALVHNAAFAGRFTEMTSNLNAYANGFDDGDGGWTDNAHPSAWTDEGLNYRSRQIAHAILRGLGVESWAVPAIDHAEWQADGSYVDLWSSAGAITTLRAAAGDPALGDDFPHWTQALGFQIDGQPAERAELVNGRVRIYPNAGAFTDATLITFGEGGAGGMLQVPEDYEAALWRDFPIVDLGLSDVPGLPLIHLPEADVLASTIAGEPVFAVTDAGPRFEDPAGAIGAGVTGYTVRAVASYDADAADSSPELCGFTGTAFNVEILTGNGRLRVNVRDGDGTYLLSGVSTPSGTLTPGAEFELLATVDHTTGFCRIWVDGALVLDEAFTPITGEVASGRIAYLLGNTAGASQFEGRVKTLQVWKQSTSDGTPPVSAPYAEITGPEATAAAHPWYVGS